MHVLSLRNTPTHCQRSLMFHIVFTLAEQLFRFCRLEKLSVVKSIKTSVCIEWKEKPRLVLVSKREYSMWSGSRINAHKHKRIFIVHEYADTREEAQHGAILLSTATREQYHLYYEGELLEKEKAIVVVNLCIDTHL